MSDKPASVEIRFLVNDREIASREAPGRLVLDFLRRDLGLVGTKEGCREGDCGACMVWVGELRGEQVEYLPMTSCLVPLGELQGKHLVTIEGLDLGQLSTVQQAIVDHGASQCGFCTPGIVMSLTALLTTPAEQEIDGEVEKALGGHLCRCTGYRSLRAAGDQALSRIGERGIEALVAAGELPAAFRAVKDRLAALAPEDAEADPTFAGLAIAGGTDLYVQRGESLPLRPVQLLGRKRRRGIDRHGEKIVIAAATSFTELEQSPELRELFPGLSAAMDTIASWQIRNRATLGGNLVNASPIGDMTVLFLALDAELSLRRGPLTMGRTLALADFYLGYKKLAKAEDELLESIAIVATPRPISFEKFAKRRALDIASVNSACAFSWHDGQMTQVRLAAGGVAPIPMRLRAAEAELEGRVPSLERVLAAITAADAEIAPIDDIRGSAAYKRLLVRQALIGHFTKLCPALKVEDFYATP
jgi:xanthine dehydrogenase small subunit